MIWLLVVAAVVFVYAYTTVTAVLWKRANARQDAYHAKEKAKQRGYYDHHRCGSDGCSSVGSQGRTFAVLWPLALIGIALLWPIKRSSAALYREPREALEMRIAQLEKELAG